MRIRQLLNASQLTRATEEKVDRQIYSQAQCKQAGRSVDRQTAVSE